MKKYLLALLLVFMLHVNDALGQKINYNHFSTKKFAPVGRKIDTFLEGKKLNLTISISFVDLTTLDDSYVDGTTCFYSNNAVEDSLLLLRREALPTMSVYKFHLALAILKQVDNGKYDLNEELFITKLDLLENTYSPLREDLKKEYAEKYEEQLKKGVAIKLNTLLSYMVSKSDNNACDMLFRLLGGKSYKREQVIELNQKYGKNSELALDWVLAHRKKYNQKGVEKVDKFIKKLGLKYTKIAASEEKMHEEFDNQYLNTTRAIDAVLLLRHFYQGNILQKNTQDFLWQLLVETSTGSNKIKAGLPADVKFGHKTGSSFRKDTDVQAYGLKAAENDIGIVVTEKKTYAIAIFIKNSTESNEVNTEIMAELSKMIFEEIK